MANDDFNRVEISRLKAELALALQRANDLQAQTHSLVLTTSTQQCNSVASPSVRSTFIERMPLEIRVQIYGELLFNPIIGTKESVVYEYGCSTTYGLTPGILSTCRQVHDEALPILYERNHFFIECTEEKNFDYDIDYCHWRQNCGCHVHESGSAYFKKEGWLNRSPLTRHWNSRGIRNSFMSLEKIPAFKKVQHWKVITCTVTYTICRSSPKSVEIHLVPKMAIEVSYQHHQSIEDSLDPLRLLRNVGNFSITRASPKDAVSIRPDLFTFEELDMPSEELQQELQLLTTGNSTVERVFEMSRALLSYAQSFERFMPFKLEMGLLNNQGIGDALGPDYDDHHRLTTTIPNPYRDGDHHPVEEALRDIAISVMWGANDPKEFKKKRAIVLEFLERQYKEIATNSDIVNVFVKAEKRLHGLFDATAQSSDTASILSNRTELAEALLSLEDYAASFIRHILFYTRAKINLLTTKLDKACANMPREMAIAHLHEAFESDNFLYFAKDFKKACDDMDKQFLEIRMARKHIFDYDITNDWECGSEFDLELHRCDEMVNWDINEPCITARWGPFRHGF
ncbi:hypothetical protein N431DRAFT_456407 [Stipitochalara longipes BDJ]|nr:hypothetical protein N431DRAFT_456407 [Stipitochalara longipes BDJ]